MVMSFPVPGRILPLAPATFRALRHRNFLLYWLGQLVSLSGSWMQSVAQGWLVLRLSNSPFQLGLVGFFAFVPVLLFTLFGGVAADRVRRRPALFWTQGLAMAQAFTLAALVWSGTVQVWHVALLAFSLGTITAFDIPIRQAFLFELVGRDDLQNAIALNSMAFNGARLVGPAIAGLVLAELGESVCFLVNAVSFLAVLVGLALIRVPRVAAEEPGGSWVGGIRDGLAYAVRKPQVRTLLVLVAISSLFGMPYSVLMPAVARDVLGGGQRMLGFLMGAAGGGAVLGALFVAGRRSTAHVGRIVALAMAVFGASLVAFSLSRQFWLSAVILLFVGGALIVQMAMSNAFLQLVAPAELRGRVVSIYTLMFLGVAPFGALLSGSIARIAGTPWAVGAGGAVCLLTAAVLAIRRPSLAPTARGEEAPT
jgi:MFS family permease